MAAGACWSSIVVGSADSAALGIGPRASALIACDLSDGHSGLHGSDGGRGGTDRRVWVMWSDYEQGPQPGRLLDPCPVTATTGGPCTLYLGHGGGHRFAGAPANTAATIRPAQVGRHERREDPRPAPLLRAAVPAPDPAPEATKTPEPTSEPEPDSRVRRLPPIRTRDGGGGKRGKKRGKRKNDDASLEVVTPPPPVTAPEVHSHDLDYLGSLLRVKEASDPAHTSFLEVVESPQTADSVRHARHSHARVGDVRVGDAPAGSDDRFAELRRLRIRSVEPEIEPEPVSAAVEAMSQTVESVSQTFAALPDEVLRSQAAEALREISKVLNRLADALE